MFKVELKENNNLIDKISKDSKVNPEYKEQIKELKKVIKEQNNEIIDLKQKVEQLEYFVRELLIFKNDITGKMGLRLHSKIVDSYLYILMLKNWINKIENSNKVIKTKLIYKLTKDGDSVDVFHKLCDNISPSLVLVETSEKRKFGRYTTCVWSSTKRRKNIFVFL
jgi:predicted RNase H-like nuclease (RuvC/YqgF family)